MDVAMVVSRTSPTGMRAWRLVGWSCILGVAAMLAFLAGVIHDLGEVGSGVFLLGSWTACAVAAAASILAVARDEPFSRALGVAGFLLALAVAWLGFALIGGL
jgi:hypothetical protein